MLFACVGMSRKMNRITDINPMATAGAAMAPEPEIHFSEVTAFNLNAA